jgi:hypothetical protein
MRKQEQIDRFLECLENDLRAERDFGGLRNEKSV